MNLERLRILARIYRRWTLGWDEGTTKHPDHGGERRRVKVNVLKAWEREFGNFAGRTACGPPGSGPSGPENIAYDLPQIAQREVTLRI
jgi:hypothetical protein